VVSHLWGRDPRAPVHDEGPALTAPARPVDASRMNTSVCRATYSTDYHVDPHAVAEAILARAHDFGDVPVIPSQVLVPADLFDDTAPGPDQLHAPALDHGA